MAASILLNGETIALTKLGMVSPEDLPPPKPGYMRLYHTTERTKNLPIIEKEGLLTSKATGAEAPKEYIWATEGPGDYSDFRPLVVFDIPEEYSKAKVNSTDYMFRRDILPEDIIAVYPVVTPYKNSSHLRENLRWDKLIREVKLFGLKRVLEVYDEDVMLELIKKIQVTSEKHYTGTSHDHEQWVHAGLSKTGGASSSQAGQISGRKRIRRARGSYTVSKEDFEQAQSDIALSRSEYIRQRGLITSLRNEQSDFFNSFQEMEDVIVVKSRINRLDQLIKQSAQRRAELRAAGDETSREFVELSISVDKLISEKNDLETKHSDLYKQWRETTDSGKQHKQLDKEIWDARDAVSAYERGDAIHLLPRYRELKAKENDLYDQRHALNEEIHKYDIIIDHGTSIERQRDVDNPEVQRLTIQRDVMSEELANVERERMGLDKRIDGAKDIAMTRLQEEGAAVRKQVTSYGAKHKKAVYDSADRADRIQQEMQALPPGSPERQAKKEEYYRALEEMDRITSSGQADYDVIQGLIRLPESKRAWLSHEFYRTNETTEGQVGIWGNGVSEFQSLVGHNIFLESEPPSIIGLMKGHPGGKTSPYGGDRAYEWQGNVYLSTNSNIRTVVHELGHVLEERDPLVKRMCDDFFGKRTVGDVARKLRDLTGDSGYAEDEVAIPDKFIDPYMGRLNAGGGEILSMGLDMFYTDPIRFARDDPDMFDFIYAIVRLGLKP